MVVAHLRQDGSITTTAQVAGAATRSGQERRFLVIAVAVVITAGVGQQSRLPGLKIVLNNRVDGVALALAVNAPNCRSRWHQVLVVESSSDSSCTITPAVTISIVGVARDFDVYWQ